MSTWRSGQVVFCLLLFGQTMCVTPVSTEYQLSFDDAASRADGAQGELSQSATYARDSAKPMFKALHTTNARCMAVLPERFESFYYVVQIAEDGRIEAVYVDTSTAYSRCFQRALLRQRLPRPPVAPYFSRGGYNVNVN